MGCDSKKLGETPVFWGNDRLCLDCMLLPPRRPYSLLTTGPLKVHMKGLKIQVIPQSVVEVVTAYYTVHSSCVYSYAVSCFEYQLSHEFFHEGSLCGVKFLISQTTLC